MFASNGNLQLSDKSSPAQGLILARCPCIDCYNVTTPASYYYYWLTDTVRQVLLPGGDNGAARDWGIGQPEHSPLVQGGELCDGPELLLLLDLLESESFHP